MTPERFAAIVAAYGADPRRWPADARAHGPGEDEGPSQDRAALIRAEAGLDRALDLYPAPLDVDAFAARALGVYAARAANVHDLPMRTRFAAPLLALAACAVVGVLLGFSAGRFAETDAADQTLAAAFSTMIDPGITGSDG